MRECGKAEALEDGDVAWFFRVEFLEKRKSVYEIVVVVEGKCLGPAGSEGIIRLARQSGCQGEATEQPQRREQNWMESPQEWETPLVHRPLANYDHVPLP